MDNQKSSLSFIIILSVLMAFTSFSIDVYLPAMPTMNIELHGNSEFTITGFLIGFSIGQLIWGPISDRIGRKIPLYIGIIIFIISSIGCALSESIESISFWRITQAFGACVGPMLSRAMIRDLYTDSKAAQLLSTLVIIMAISPLAGPFIGSGILEISNWHMIFWMLAFVGLLVFLSIFMLPETLSSENKDKTPITTSFKTYGKLIKNKKFMASTLSVAFFYVTIYAFVAGSPFVYIEYFKISPQDYGFYYGINILGVMALSIINKFLVNHFKLTSLLVTTTIFASLASVVLIWLVLTNIAGVLGLVIPIFMIFSMNGIINATSTVVALDSVPNSMAGSAAALLGALQYGSGIISTALISIFHNGTPWTMTWIMALFVFLSMLTAVWAKITKSNKISK